MITNAQLGTINVTEVTFPPPRTLTNWFWHFSKLALRWKRGRPLDFLAAISRCRVEETRTLRPSSEGVDSLEKPVGSGWIRFGRRRSALKVLGREEMKLMITDGGGGKTAARFVWRKRRKNLNELRFITSTETRSFVCFSSCFLFLMFSHHRFVYSFRLFDYGKGLSNLQTGFSFPFPLPELFYFYFPWLHFDWPVLTFSSSSLLSFSFSFLTPVLVFWITRHTNHYLFFLLHLF